MFVFLFNDKEKQLLKKVEVDSNDEMMYWKLPNIIYPFGLIVLSLLCYFLFKPSEKFTAAAWLNILFNGSLPMIALNRIGSMGINLFKFDKSKEKVFKTDTTLLRVKIDEYSKFLVLLIVLHYIYQVIQGPFNVSWLLLLQLLTSSIIIRYALVFSKYAYLLQERLLERSLADEIRDDANEGKQNLSEKYGD